MENKRKIDEYISKAINILNNNNKIVKEGGKIDKVRLQLLRLRYQQVVCYLLLLFFLIMAVQVMNAHH